MATQYNNIRVYVETLEKKGELVVSADCWLVGSSALERLRLFGTDEEPKSQPTYLINIHGMEKPYKFKSTEFDYGKGHSEFDAALGLHKFGRDKDGKHFTALEKDDDNAEPTPILRSKYLQLKSCNVLVVDVPYSMLMLMLTCWPTPAAICDGTEWCVLKSADEENFSPVFLWSSLKDSEFLKDEVSSAKHAGYGLVSPKTAVEGIAQSRFYKIYFALLSKAWEIDRAADGKDWKMDTDLESVVKTDLSDLDLAGAKVHSEVALNIGEWEFDDWSTTTITKYVETMHGVFANHDGFVEKLIDILEGLGYNRKGTLLDAMMSDIGEWTEA